MDKKKLWSYPGVLIFLYGHPIAIVMFMGYQVTVRKLPKGPKAVTRKDRTHSLCNTPEKVCVCVCVLGGGGQHISLR